MKPPLIIACNTGSSSCKVAFYEIQLGEPTRVGSLYIHWQGHDTTLDQVHIELPEGDYANLPALVKKDDLTSWLTQFVRLASYDHCELSIVHRVVHGGGQYRQPTIANREVIHELYKLTPLAPLHQSYNLDLVEAIRMQLPDVKHVLCFDTAFHHTLPALQQLLPLPKALHHMGLRRYGFHGLSYEYLTREVRKKHPEWAHKKQVYAHLGSGASVCAVKHWQSVDSSMGLTALDGLPMSTRPGSLDPGALLYLMELGYTAKELERLLYKESGLLGISGVSSDVRKLLEDGSAQAEQAIHYFCWKTAQWIAQMSVTLGGLDVLVFSGGIGENQPAILQRICRQLTMLGVDNICSGPLSHTINYLSEPEAPVQVLSMKTNEELMMVNHCHHLLKEHNPC